MERQSLESTRLTGLESQFHRLVDMTSSKYLTLSRFQLPLLKTRGDGRTFLTGRGLKQLSFGLMLYRAMLL